MFVVKLEGAIRSAGGLVHDMAPNVLLMFLSNLAQRWVLCWSPAGVPRITASIESGFFLMVAALARSAAHAHRP
jgi:hypothetical protein